MEKQFKDYLTPPVLLIIFLLALSLFVTFPVLNMVILGAILALGLKSISVKLQKKVKYPSISVILAIIIAIIPLILLIIYIIAVVVGFVSDTVVSSSAVDLNQTASMIMHNLHMQNNIQDITVQLDNIIKQIGTFIVNYAVKLLSSMADIILQLFIFFASLFYFTRDGHKCIAFVKSFVPEDSKQFFDDTFIEVKSVLKCIFFGHFLTSLIIGIIAAIGYSLLGYDYGIFLGVITGIFQLIPVMGPWPIYWALAILDLLNGNYIRLVIVLLFGFGLSLSDMYIRPALSSHYADIPPLILLIGFLAGPLVYGIVGFILGPLILGITYAVLVSYKNEREKHKEET